MKYFLIGILILALLLVGCGLSGRVIEARTEAAAAALEAALAAEPERAAALARGAAAEWERSEALLSSLLSHRETQEIGALLAELDGLRGAAFTRACERALRAIRALAEAQRPLWKNIL